MKLRVWAALLLALVLCVPTGCGLVTSDTAISPNDVSACEGGDRAALLSGYPADTLPLYRCARVLRCSVMLYDWEDAVEPRADEYYLAYETDAQKEDVLSFYEELLDENPGKTSASLSGTIGGKPANISVSANAGLLQVVLNIGVPDAGGAYFDNCPGAMEVLGGESNQPYYRVYALSAESGSLSEYYSICCYTNLSLADFADLYETAYGDKPGFLKSDTDCELRYSFDQDGYTNEAFLNKFQIDASQIMLTIDCRTK